MVIFMSGNRRHEPIVIVAHVRTTTTTLKGEIKQTFPPFYVPRFRLYHPPRQDWGPVCRCVRRNLSQALRSWWDCVVERWNLSNVATEQSRKLTMRIALGLHAEIMRQGGLVHIYYCPCASGTYYDPGTMKLYKQVLWLFVSQSKVHFKMEKKISYKKQAFLVRGRHRGVNCLVQTKKFCLYFRWG